MKLFDQIGAIFNNPAQPAEQTQNSTTSEGPGIADQWRSWLNKPENAAALMQTGISLTQPLQLGQNTLGAMTSAVGQGFEARDRVIQNQNDQQQQALANSQSQNKLAIDKKQLELQAADTAANVEYKQNLGLSSILNANKNKTKIVTPKNSRTWAEFYDQERKNAQGAFVDVNTPEFLNTVKQAWILRQNIPNDIATPPDPSNLVPDATMAVPSTNSKGSNPDPVPTGLQAKIDAAKAKGISAEKIKQAIIADGINPNVIPQLQF